MRKRLRIVTIAFVALLAALSAVRVQVVQVEQFCSNRKHWRVTMTSPNPGNLGLTSGVYRARSYSMTNGFGLVPAGETWLSVPFPPNPNGAPRFGP